MSASIEVDNLSVRFLVNRQRRLITPAHARMSRKVTTVLGLRGISLSARAGEGIALIGPSGSGKTTLLRVLAGVYSPDGGTVRVRGRVGSLLSIEAGLLPDLTGRESAVTLGVLNGLTYSAARAAVPALAERASLAEAFDRPVSSFSQGMRARLGFAVAEQAEPTILLLDEVHEALDHEFRDRVEQRARQTLEAGGVVVAAGHDHEMLARLCRRGIWLRDGHIAMDGELGAVRSAYLAP